MGNEVNIIPEGNDHLTALQLAAWLSAAPQAAASPTANHAALDEHLHTCAVCRAQLVMLRQATQLDSAPDLTVDAEPEFAALLKLGEQAALSAHREAQPAARTARTQSASTQQLGWRVWLNWRVALPVAAMLLLAGGGWWWWTQQAPLRKANEAFQLAWRDRRPVESRISGLSYAPFIQTRDNSEALTDRLAHDRGERILLEELHERPTPATSHALGKHYLADRKFDQAIQQFEVALKATPNDAQLLNDLGATYIEKGKAVAPVPESSQKLVEYARAYEQLERAIGQKNAPLEAFYNHAHCLQLLSLPQQAREAWQKYLNFDNSSAWADEARRNLQLLEGQQRKNSLTREQLFDNFMAGWRAKDDEAMWQAAIQKRSPLDGGLEERLVNAYLQADKDNNRSIAQENITILTKLGDSLSQRTSERFTTDLAAYYRRANKQQRELSLKGNALMQSALAKSRKGNTTEAIAEYIQAQKHYLKAENEPQSLLADFRLGYVYAFQPNLKLAESGFNHLHAISRVKRYFWLQFWATMGLAQVSAGKNEYSQSITLAHQAEKIASNLGDITAPIRAFSQLAYGYFSVNNTEQSLYWLERIFNTGQLLTSDSGQRWNLLTQTGRSFSNMGLVHAALACHQEALQLAELSELLLEKTRSLNYLGDAYGRVGKNKLAINAFSQAVDIGKSLGEENGTEFIGYSALRLGDYYRQTGDYAKAVNWYQQSEKYYERLGFGQFLYATHKGKLLSSYSAHDDAAVIRELPTVLRLFDEHRGKIYHESQRNSFFDREQSVYDLAINFEYTRQGNSTNAFNISEESRARSLHDLLAISDHSTISCCLQAKAGSVFLTNSPSLTLAQVIESMPSQVQLIQYTALDDKLLIWVITHQNMLTKDVSISLPALSRQIERFRTQIMQPVGVSAKDLQETAHALHNLLIKPIAATLDQEKILCIVPDKSLHNLPFQALINESTGKYLIESYALMYSASASTFIASTKAARKRYRGPQERVLTVGNPSINSALQLQALPESQHEAETIATLYSPQSRALVGKEANEIAVRRELSNVEIAHFATHYLIDKKSVADSQLILAWDNSLIPSTKTDGKLHNAEIADLPTPRLRLVILSACQTGAEKIIEGEGSINAARSFLARQVPLVIASLWPVDSAATDELMTTMHEARRLSHRTTIDALRLAQIKYVRRTNSPVSHPYYWAAFSLFGGYAAF